MKRCVIPLIPVTPGAKRLDIIIYGRSARELMTVPNEIVHSLARRYPGYTSSPFFIYNLPQSYT